MSEINYSLDVSLISAKHDLITRSWDFSIFSIAIELLIKASVDDIFDYFINNSGLKFDYRIEFGKYAILWTDNLTVRFDGNFGAGKIDGPKRYEDEVVIAGEIDAVRSLTASFREFVEDKKINRNHNVDWVSKGSNGLETVSIPVKSGQRIFNEMYPCLPKPVDEYIEDFIKSSSNVLILTGPPGMGKSAFINHLVVTSGLRSQVVYDPAVMSADGLYSSFIQRCFRDEGGIMIMEDSDLILTSREISGNEVMAKILNISDGIIDTSSAKFVFTANLNNISDIDEALTRPGRCFDIVNFRSLNFDEATIAAKAIGKELIGNKKEYSVAEIYNQKDDAASRNKLGGMGFGFRGNN